MWFLPRRALSRALLLVGPLFFAGPSMGTPYAERVRETVLPNGLKLILLEDHKAPVAVFQIWYRVGSRNEVLGHTGLSHLLEHMMFKGTPSVGPEEYNRIIQRNGGQTNAFTSKDYTTYFATIASDRLGVVTELEADRMVNLILNEAVFNPERDVVKEERRLRVDNHPVAALFEQLAATAFVAHPYQFPIIGWMNDIDRSTVDDLARHYRAYYVPNNAFVVAVGDFGAAELSADIARAFGEVRSGESPPPVRSLEPVQRGERRLELRREAELPYVALAYHVPGLATIDGPALEVLATLLAGGESARLYHTLVYERRLARNVGADYDSLWVDPGLFTVYAQPLPGKPPATLEGALLHEIERLKNVPPSEAELAKVKKGIESAFIFAQDSLFYQALLLGQYEICGDWRRIDEYMPAVRAVTGDDITRVAGFYLDRDNRTVATLVPISPDGARAAPAPPVEPDAPLD
jgi:zinc protease